MRLTHFTYRNDAQLKNELLAGNEKAVRYVFYDHFTPLLRINAAKATAVKGIPFEDLIQELYLYLSADDWAKLRKYDPQLPFVNWFSVVSYRFFKDFSRSMIDSAQIMPISNTNEHEIPGHDDERIMIRMDLQNAIANMWPPRDKEILESLIVRDEPPETVAARHGVTVDNLYNIKRRALAKLIQIHLTGYKEK